MATTYPGALDTFTNKKVIDLEDAIEALEARIGITGSADTSSVTYLLSKSVRTDTNQTITGEKTFQQVSGSIPLRIHSTEPQSGTHLLEVLGPSRSGGAERYTFMIDQGGNVRMNTALTISGGTADVGNIPPEPIAGASYAIGILNDIAPGGGGMDRDAGILSVLGIPGQIHMRCFDSSEQLQFEIGPTGAVKVQLWEPTAIGIHVRGSFGQSGKLLRLWNSDSTEMFGVSAAGAVTAAGGTAIGGNFTTTSVSSAKIAFIGNPDLNAGIACESGGTSNDILNIGVNDTRFGAQYAAMQGGFLRFDARAGQPVATFFVRPASGSLVSAFTVNPDTSVVFAGPIQTTATGGGDTLTLALTATSVANSGTKGLRLNRAAIGAPLGLTLLTANSAKWDAVTLDYNTSDLVLAGSHNTDGAGTFGDQLRLSQEGNGEYGKSVGLQSSSRRFSFSSNSTDNVLMTTLLMLDVQTGSPVTTALNVTSAGNTTARISTDGRFVLGPLTATSSAGVSCHTAAVSDLKGALEVNNSGTSGQRYQIIPGQLGVTNGGLTVRDATNSVDRITITPAGTIRLGVAGDIATNSTDGFIRVPVMNGAPTGTPTAYGGDSGGAHVLDRSNGRAWYYINGVGWRGTATLTT